jgi:hypothetical protein
MIRAWILLSCLVISTLFRAFSEETEEYFHFFYGKPFLFSGHLMDKHSYTYFFMELVIAMAYVGSSLIQDSTPRAFIWLFLGILFLDLLHFMLWFRDPGPGWNLIKTLMFGIPLLFVECRRIWSQSKL